MNGSWAAVPFFLIYMVLMYCIILNAVVAVVLAHFQNTEDVGRHIFEDLRTKWAVLDPYQTKTMSFTAFCILIRTLEQPVGTAVPQLPSQGLSLRWLNRRYWKHRKHLEPGAAFDPSVLSARADFVNCLRALEDLHVPLTRQFTVRYEQVWGADTRLGLRPPPPPRHLPHRWW